MLRSYLLTSIVKGCVLILFSSFNFLSVSLGLSLADHIHNVSLILLTVSASCMMISHIESNIFSIVNVRRLIQLILCEVDVLLILLVEL